MHVRCAAITAVLVEQRLLARNSHVQVVMLEDDTRIVLRGDVTGFQPLYPARTEGLIKD